MRWWQNEIIFFDFGIMGTGVFDVNGCGKLLCLWLVLGVAILGTAVALPVGLAKGTDLSGCCVALITVLSTEAMMLLSYFIHTRVFPRHK
jgi:hypothetical protein